MSQRHPVGTDVLVPVRHTDQAHLRSVFARFPSGVAAVAASGTDGAPAVLVASSFQVGISFAPPLVMFAVQHTSTSWPKLRSSARLGISILAEHHGPTARKLATRGSDRFEGIEVTSSASGALSVAEAAAWLEVSLYSETPAGDHDVVLLEVHSATTLDGLEPLIWHGSVFRALTVAVGGSDGG